MELKQIKSKKAVYEIWFVIFVIIIVISFIAYLSYPIMMVGFIIGGLGAAFITRLFKKLSTQFKQIYIKEMLIDLIPGCTYLPSKGLDSEFVYASKILKKEDRYSSEDYLEGTLSGKHFISADVHLKDVRSNGKTTSVVTMFQGRFFSIDFDKKFENDVYVMPNRTYLFSVFEGFQRVELEYIKFNQVFDVFSKDQHSAFYLLKPRLMEKLIEFSRIARRTMFGFKNRKAYIAIDTRVDTFDLKMFKEIDMHFFNEVKREVQLIKDLIALIP